MQSLNRNLVVVDIETSGPNPFKHDALAVAFVPMMEAIPHRQFFIAHNNIQWSDFALRNFSRFKKEWAASAIPCHSACDAIEDYVHTTFNGETVTLIGHNIGFDVAFLRKIAYQGGRDQIAGISHRIIDTHTLLYLLSLEGKVPHLATSSDGAFKHFGISVADEIRHTALGDALATKELFHSVVQLLLTEDTKELP